MEPVKLREITEYSIADKEAAYEVYKDVKQGSRSLRKTSRLTNIPLGTLQYWQRTLNWQARIFAEDERTAQIIDQVTRLKLVNELDGLMDHLIYLAYNGTNNDKVQADMVKHALAMVGMSAIQKVQQDVTQVVEARHTVREESIEVESLSTEDLGRLLTERLAELSEERSQVHPAELAEKSGDAPSDEGGPAEGGTENDTV